MMKAPENVTIESRSLLAISDLNKDEIVLILNTAETLRELAHRKIKKLPTLRGKTVINLFFEPSTRTRTSFEAAAKWLSADAINFSPSSSAAKKGESLKDTARTLNAMKADVIVIRHSTPGAAHLLSREVNAAVINGGDGAHEHPTQALLDIMTIRKRMGRLQGLKVAIVGDILHSRVARSGILGLKTMGAEVFVVGPPTLMPPFIEKYGVRVSHDFDEVIPEVDIIMMLRMQLERQTAGLIPSLREYSRLYGLTPERIAGARSDVLVMHPGPINRGIEIDARVADDLGRSLILEQVLNGVIVRMALLYLVLGGRKSDVA